MSVMPTTNTRPSGPGAALALMEAEAEIERLQAEVERLRARLATFETQLFPVTQQTEAAGG